MIAFFAAEIDFFLFLYCLTWTIAVVEILFYNTVHVENKKI